MRRFIAVLAAFIVCSFRPVEAFNPVTDVQTNLKWTLGDQALLGTAYKIGGSAGTIKNGYRGDSTMFGLFDYRFIKESYGVIRDPSNGNKLGDGLKTGLQLNYFLGWFKSPQTTAMAFLNNVNIGPVVTVPIVTSPHGAAIWIEANYQFGK